MQSHRVQLRFGRTVRITLKWAGTYSSISETSSPNGDSDPPQSGQAVCRGSSVSISRGNAAGSGRRAGLLASQYRVEGLHVRHIANSAGQRVVTMEIFLEPVRFLNRQFRDVRP
jgi:hypothetical protein